MSGGRGATPDRRWATSLPRPRHGDSGDDTGRQSVLRHREAVVRRLLDRGLTPTVLVALLPDFRSVVQRVLSRSGPGAP